MGDSEGAQRTFEELDDDIAAAAQALLERQAPGTRLVLWGLCDGASAALLYLERRADPRVAGMVLLNPWVRSEASLARTQVKHYYGQRLMQPEFWQKLLRGGIGLGALRGFLRSVASARRPAAAQVHADYRGAMASAWKRFGGPMLLMLSDSDYTAREFEDCATTEPAWQGALARSGLRICHLADADHTLSSAAAKSAADGAVTQWLGTLAMPAGHTPD
jgi:exosortase A-associated hydrolase 1